MKQFRQSALSLSMAAALAIGGMSVSTGAMAAPSVGTAGQALVFPYYTVNDGWETLFNLTNTSDKTLALKVRFHESNNSRDVLDFNLVLSPRDVWTGWVEDSTSGRPVLKTADTSCAAPAIPSAGVAMSEIAFTGANDDNGSNSLDRMREGYMEVILMGATDADPSINPAVDAVNGNLAAYNAKHVDGVPRGSSNGVCTSIESAFKATTNAAVADHVSGNPAMVDLMDFPIVDGFNPLTGNFTLLNKANGVAAGGQAVAIADLHDSTVYTTDNLVTAQEYPYFLEPTLASRDGLWTVSGLGDVDEALGVGMADTMQGDWSTNAKNGVDTDWIITFPTKAYHVDQFNTLQAGNPPQRGAALAPFANVFDESALDADDGKSTVQVTYNLYDREEGETTVAGISFSPAPPGASDNLQYEANVLHFGENSLLGSNFGSRVDPSALTSGKTTGWLNADIGSLPAVGLIVKQRNFGDRGANFGQAYPLSYVSP